ncbi:MAG: TetR/AcrR family transcriptional regulator [Desulfuromonadales bacterium]|nr:TetR/AcrR family transcriptional regulator [Desulfuromonadales bacterium]
MNEYSFKMLTGLNVEKCDKRKEIFKAALELFTTEGFHGAPMAMIAQSADVATGTIYRYFENRDALINELYLEIENKLTIIMIEQYNPEHPIRERFIKLGTELLRFFINNPFYFMYIEQFYNSPYGIAIRKIRSQEKKDSKNKYLEIFNEGIEKNQIRKLPYPALFAIAFGPLFTVARDHILGFITLNNQIIEEIIEASWNAINI